WCDWSLCRAIGEVSGLICAADAAVCFECGVSPPHDEFLSLFGQRKEPKERPPHGAAPVGVPCGSRGASLPRALRAACAVQIGSPADLSRQSRARPTGLPSPDVRVPASLPAPFGQLPALAA